MQTEKLNGKNGDGSICELPILDANDTLPDCLLESKGLPIRVVNTLQRAGLRYAREYVYLPDEELIKIRNLGQKCIMAIRDWCSIRMKDHSDY